MDNEDSDSIEPRRARTEPKKPATTQNKRHSATPHPRSKSVCESSNSLQGPKEQEDDDKQKKMQPKTNPVKRQPKSPPTGAEANKRKRKSMSPRVHTTDASDEEQDSPEAQIGVLAFCFHEGRELPAMDSTGKSDPYIKLFFEGIDNPKHKWQSSVERQTLSPVWEDGVCVPVHRLPVVIKFECWDKDYFSKDDFIGVVEIVHAEAKDVLVEGKWLDLKSQKDLEDKEPKEKEKERERVRDNSPVTKEKIREGLTTKLGKIKVSYHIKFGARETARPNLFVRRKRKTLADRVFSFAGIPRHRKIHEHVDETEISLFEYIATNDISGLQHFLKSATPEVVNSLDEFGNSALHVACLDCESLDRTILELLLSFRGINVSIRNHSHSTPLHYLCYKWPGPDLQYLNLMFKMGADVNAINDSKESPLFKAIQNTCFRKPIMEWLLEQKAKPDLLNSHGEGILHYAARLGRADLVNLILKYSSDIKLRGAEGLTPREVARLNADTAVDMDVKVQWLSIVHTLDAVQDLDDFLRDNGLSECRAYFMEEEIDLETLYLMRDDDIVNLGFDASHTQKLIAALHARKRRQAEEDSRINQRLSRGNPLQSAQQQQQYEKKLEEIKTMMAAMRSEAYGEINVITRHQLEYLDELGQGASSTVWKGLLRCDVHMAVDVAIKILFTVTDEDLTNFKKEFIVLTRIDHPNVVRLFGVAFQPKLAMVMEYCARGSLYHALSDESIYFSWPLFFQVACETVEGLLALHSFEPQILHRDLKTLNLLLTADWHVRVADFGLSMDTNSGSDALRGVEGTVGYMDPELAKDCKFTAKSDIYSLGIVFWEMLQRVITGHYLKPYEEFDQVRGPIAVATILFLAADGKRPTIPEKTPECLANLVKECYNEVPDARPDVQHVKRAMKASQRRYKSNKSAWDALLPPPPRKSSDIQVTKNDSDDED